MSDQPRRLKRRLTIRVHCASPAETIKLAGLPGELRRLRRVMAAYSRALKRKGREQTQAYVDTTRAILKTV